MGSTNKQLTNKLGSKPLLILWSIVFGLTYIVYCHHTHILLATQSHPKLAAFFFDAKSKTGIIVKLYLALILAQPIAGLLSDILSPTKLLCLAISILSLTLIGYQIFLTQVDLLNCLTLSLALSICFIGCLRLACRILSSKNFSLYIAFVCSYGLFVSALMYSEQTWSLPNIDWNYFEVSLSAICFICIPYFLVHDALPRVTISTRQQWQQWLQVFNDQKIWIAGFFAGLMYVPLSTFADFWGKFYLASVYTLPPNIASLISSIIILGACIGTPLQVYISLKTRDITLVMFYNAIISLVMLLVILYMPHLSYIMVAAIFLVTGVSLSSYILSFILVTKNHNHSSSLGLRIAMNNFMKLLASIVILELISRLLVSHWSGLVANHQVIYSHFNYEVTLSIIPVCLALAVIVAHILHVTRANASFDLTMYDIND